ncbi:MAG: hypothetical protein US96_C0051G0002 [Candidatus Woesebacteria bacterium GW2011_GWB1_38_5b]|uniref:PIN domain-containing protein n=1 Tax=Candidatus Woesebacteria bacterium GW2011_GWB1_38_5b TaxID=1618569 RepID=A0A0G0MJ98_9BACT|nr:MAG: hypothetical protein US96_C0051G0002 [Candidatus Woesebacteria bacterium GW2011_GWB1_38_5b]
MRWAKERKFKGIISEIVYDEALRHRGKIRFRKTKIEEEIATAFYKISPAPRVLNLKYKKIVRDVGDIHVFTSAKENKVDYLVSLDKKHILSVKRKIKEFKIVSPAELIQIIEKK